MYALVGMPQGYEWLIIGAIVILLFGAKKLPDLARNSGKALTEFKKETKTLRSDDKDEAAGELTQGETTTQAQPAPPVQQPVEQAAQQPAPPVQQPNPQVNGRGPGDTPPQSSH